MWDPVVWKTAKRSHHTFGDLPIVFWKSSFLGIPITTWFHVQNHWRFFRIPTHHWQIQGPASCGFQERFKRELSDYKSISTPKKCLQASWGLLLVGLWCFEPRLLAWGFGPGMAGWWPKNTTPKGMLPKLGKERWKRSFQKSPASFFDFGSGLVHWWFFGCFFFWFWKGKYLGINFTHQIEMMFFIFIRGGVEGHRTHRPPKKHPPKTAQWGVSPCFSFFLEGVYCHWRLCWKIG